MPSALQPEQMRAYFALTEAVSLLQYAVAQQLQADGGLSYVQFEILATVADASAGGAPRPADHPGTLISWVIG